MPPKVSIVLPNYNYARYLDERITSLLGQTFRDFELIITDDASTDGSREVIEKYADDTRVRTVWFDKNSGVAYRRWNDGAALAQGEYLLFAGADDSCEPTLLERLVRVLDENPNVGIAYAQSWVIDADGKRGKLTPSWHERWSRDFIATGVEEAPFLLVKNTIPNASAALLRRSVVERCGGFDVSLALAADCLLWAKMLTISDLAYVAKPLNYFRSHADNVRSRLKGNALILEHYRVTGLILETFPIMAEDRERMLEKLGQWWASGLAGRSLTDLSMHRNILREARRADQKIVRRMIRIGCEKTSRRIVRQVRLGTD